MAVNIAGIISIIVFYFAILLVGIFAARKQDKGKEGDAASEEVILAGRNIGLFVGCFTMTATWVGGGYINGTAESVYDSGLVWVQAPWGYATSLIFGGIFFAKRMREMEYVTMLDPLQDRYGRVMGGILYIPALMGETFWSASILGALGATLSVILDINMNYSVPASAVIAVGYTFFGGLYSVAYTDVIQLICIFVGLWLCAPFAMSNENAVSITENTDDWIGKLKGYEVGLWLDYAFLLICGGIPWQVYFQRVLSSTSATRARLLSFVAAAGCIVSVIPAILIGAVANNADWVKILGENSSYIEKSDAYHPTIAPHLSHVISDKRLVLPMVLQYMTNPAISFIGLGAVSAAVMSSADSSVLSASSMFAYNIYTCIFRKQASATETIWVLRAAICVVGVLATVVGLTVKSIYDLFHLCSDLVFVCLFPQLLCAVHVPWVNTYGSASAMIIGLIFRLTGGEERIGLPAAIKWPGWRLEDVINDDGSITKIVKQYFPFRTVAMLMSLATLLLVSYGFNKLIEKGIINENNDYFGVIERKRKLPAKERKRLHPKVASGSNLTDTPMKSLQNDENTV